MHLILPEESQARKLETVSLLHPYSGEPAKFLIDQGADAPHVLYELTAVGNDVRSALVDTRVSQDATLVVATPLHPLFLVLGQLFAQRTKPLPLDTLLELTANDDTQSLPEQFVEPFLPSVVDSNNGLVVLNLEKLKIWMDGRVARVRAGLPPSIRQEVLRAVQPIDTSATLSSELLEMAEMYAAVSMLITSWVSPQLGEWFLSTYDFSELENAAARVHDQHLALHSMQFANKEETSKRREPSESAKPAKKAKTLSAKNNTSILDMFKKKA